MPVELLLLLLPLLLLLLLLLGVAPPAITREYEEIGRDCYEAMRRGLGLLFVVDQGGGEMRIKDNVDQR